MKRPISVTIASIIYFIFSALYCFLYVTFAIYTPDQFLQNLADAYSFLPSWLSIIVSVGFAAMPVFIAVGKLAENGNMTKHLTLFIRNGGLYTEYYLNGLLPRR